MITPLKHDTKRINFINRAYTPLQISSERWASFYVIISTLILAYGGRLGPISIVVFLAIWFSRAQYRGILTIKPREVSKLAVILLIWISVSTLWSDVPKHTLYTALEYSSLVVCAIIMGTVVSTRAFLHGLILGCSIVLLISLTWGHYALDPFTGTWTMVGLFGSKNVVGLFAEILIIAGLTYVKIIRGLAPRMIYLLLSMSIGLICLVKSRSATSVISLIFTMAFWFALYIVTSMPRRMRLSIFLFAALWGVTLISIGYILDWHEEIFRFFGKSSNLTGRTLIWEKGIEYGLDNLLTGTGYSAFWVRGNLLAEQLWFKFGIYGRQGFHFHNLFVQAFVNIGLIGAGILMLLFASMWIKALRYTLKYKESPEFLMALIFTTMFLIRTYSEVDITGTYGIGPFVFFALTPIMYKAQKQQKKKSYV